MIRTVYDDRTTSYYRSPSGYLSLYLYLNGRKSEISPIWSFLFLVHTPNLLSFLPFFFPISCFFCLLLFYCFCWTLIKLFFFYLKTHKVVVGNLTAGLFVLRVWRHGLPSFPLIPKQRPSAAGPLGADLGARRGAADQRVVGRHCGTQRSRVQGQTRLALGDAEMKQSQLGLAV